MIKHSRHFFTPNIVKDFMGLIEYLHKNTFLNSFLERFFKVRFKATEKAVFSPSSGSDFNSIQSNLYLINLDKEIDNYLDVLNKNSFSRNKILSKLAELQEKRKNLLFLRSEFNLDFDRK